MSKADTFIDFLYRDIRVQGFGLDDAAYKAKVSPRQFKRQIKGENREGIMPLDTAAELRKEGVISRETALCYLEESTQKIKTALRLKAKKKKGRGNRWTLTIKNLLFK